MNPYAYTPAERRLAQLLGVLSWVGLALTVVALIGVAQGLAPGFFVEAPFAAGTFVALGVLTLLAWFAAGDVRRFREMVHLLTVGLAFVAITCLALLFSPNGPTQQTPLIIGAAIGIVLMLLTGALSMSARPEPNALVARPWLPDKPVTGWERIGQIVSLLSGLTALALAAATLALAFSAPPQVDFFKQPLMVAGLAAAFGLLGVCALLAARDIRRYSEVFSVFVLGIVLALVGDGVALLSLGASGANPITLAGATLTLAALMQLAVLIDVVLVALFFALRNRMNRALLDQLRFFGPFQFRALEGMVETLIGGGQLEKVPPYQIALRTDSYLGSFDSSRLWLSRLAVMGIDLGPLLMFKPPLSFLHPDLRREFVDRQFKREILNPRGVYWFLEKVGPKQIINFLEGGMRFCMQLSYVGYYGDPRAHKDIGYVPFSERPKNFPVQPVRDHPPLRVMTPDVLDREGIDTISNAGVVIIGSGAGGAILAERLADLGREVLLVERGEYISPDNFTEDEVGMIGHLYGDGALQIAQSLRFTVLQGSAVGGSTVVNNAVCFDTPDRVLAAWNDDKAEHASNAGIDVVAFKQAQRAVRARMNIRSIKHSSQTRPWQEVLNPGDTVIEKGIQAYLSSIHRPYQYDVVETNIADCLGCGYCNTGCKYGRKLSMLDQVLPAAQAKHGPDKFRIVSNAEVFRLKGSGGKITEVLARVQGRRLLTIRKPKTVIVSAGTVASSWLLMQSGIGQGELPVGRWLCFNMGSPLHAWFGEKLNSYAGLQIAHYLELPEENGEVPGFVYETWYNPPVAQALAMPGWLDTHFQNMRRYSEMVAVGVLVGTLPNPDARLTRALFLRGAPDIVYAPTRGGPNIQGDLNVLAEALVTLGKILLAAGAKEVYASTRKYQSYSAIGAQKAGRKVAILRAESEIEGLGDMVKSENDILLGTGHPQGGNRISKNRGRNGIDGGVIDPDFKVYGFDNLYVCDASVFPSATTVNPQLTVMTLAHYAADRINGK